MNLEDLPDIDFTDTDAQTVETEVFAIYESVTGRTLARADPIRLFLLFITEEIVRLLNIIDTGKQNLLKYSRGGNLDNLAAMAWVSRTPAEAARTTMAVTLSAAREKETIVPKGTRISPESNLYFATDKSLVIPAGETTGKVGVTCQTIGAAGNGYKPGEIKNIVDPIAYVASMVNETASEGGSDEEGDEALRQRVQEAPEALSVAGPAGAYRAHAMVVSSLISDVAVMNNGPGNVRVVPLLTGGESRGTEMLKDIAEALSADDVRPLTDNVEVIAPEAVPYDVKVSYWVQLGEDAKTIQAAAETAVTAYTTWQKAKLGRDIVPSKLIQLLMAVPSVKRVNVEAPVYKEIQGHQIAKEGTVSAVMAGSEEE